jgi:hypothetical protein
LGKNFVRGLVDGIQSAAGWLWDAVTGLIQGMLDRMYEMLDMHSPSGVGKRVGRNLFSSIGIGGEEEQANLQRKVTRILGNLTANMQANLSPLTGGGLQPALATAGGGSISLGNIYIDARGAQEPEKIGQAVRNGVLSVLRSKGVR